MTTSDNAMRRQVFSLPQLLKEQYEDLEPKTRKCLTTPEIFSIQKIILTGCGDSHAAAIAAKYAFAALTGIPTEVVSAIELSRYYPENQLGFAPRNPLVIAVSNSGSVARVGECVRRATEHHAFTLGITGNSESVLAENSSRVLPLKVPPFEASAGVRTYAVSILSLLLLAIRIGEVRGRYTMDTAMEYRNDILKQAELLEKMLPEIDHEIMLTSEEWKDMEAFDFVGSGPDYATAFYGQAKIFEATGRYSMYVNTEEWMHLNCFMKNYSRIGTVVICGKESPAKSRAGEMIRYAERDLHRPLLFISDERDADLQEVKQVITPKSSFSFGGILTGFIPVALLAGNIGGINGEKDGRGCEGNWSFCKDGAAIKNSEIIIL